MPLRGIALSPDGNYVFVTHNLGRFQVPTSQLQQGWMNTSAMSVIDTQTQSFSGSVLLDEPRTRGSRYMGYTVYTRVYHCVAFGYARVKPDRLSEISRSL